MNSKAFAEWLSQQRKDAGWTQAVLAKKAGCEKAYISKFESPPVGQAPVPSLEFLDRLSRSFGVSVTVPLTAMGFIKPQSDSEPHLLRLINYYKALPRDEQKLADELVKTLWRLRAPKPEIKPTKKRIA